jgi:DNA-binding transcriptional MerR regulator
LNVVSFCDEPSGKPYLYVNVKLMQNAGMDKRTWSIGELAREFDITTRTIRFYEDEGLLQPQRRGQTRIYHPKDRVRLTLILRGKRLGFSLSESRELIDMYNPASDNRAQLQALLDKIVERREQLAQQLRDIASLQSELDEVERRCRDAMKTA